MKEILNLLHPTNEPDQVSKESDIFKAISILNSKLLRAGCKMTIYIDGRREGYKKPPDKDYTKFRSTIAEKEYQKWMRSNVYCKEI